MAKTAWAIIITGALATLVIPPLTSVSGLQCCRCLYIQDHGETCNCGSKPERKNCSDAMPTDSVELISSVGTGKRGGDVYACTMVTGIFNASHRFSGLRFVGRRYLETAVKSLPASCTLGPYPEQYGLPEDAQGCFCGTDWCNCISLNVSGQLTGGTKPKLVVNSGFMLRGIPALFVCLIIGCVQTWANFRHLDFSCTENLTHSVAYVKWVIKR
jgi:hypothetical protein